MDIALESVDKLGLDRRVRPGAVETEKSRSGLCRGDMSTDVLSSRAMQWASKVQSIADQARDMTLEAAQSVGARYADESKAVDINKLLEGRSDREKIDGMRRTIALSSRGTDMSEHFASVVKNVASSNLELRKLVYIYITRYAESQPDLALLSINTIQKALSDQNQIVRALALRVMSSIRVSSISGIVLLAIKKCMTDSSFYVRKTAAMAISKTNSLDPNLHTELLKCLKVLLADHSPAVLSSAFETFETICPDRLDLIHPNYRRTCAVLDQMDEFGQVNVLRVLEAYARKCFMTPNAASEGDSEQEFYNQTGSYSSVDPDLTILLNSVQSLLNSRSSAAVLASCRIIHTIGPQTDLHKVARPLLALMRSSTDVRYIALQNIAVLALGNPSIWQKFAKHFIVYPFDPEYIWMLKLEIITLIISPDNATLLLSELAQYSGDTTNETLARHAIRAIGQCAQHFPEVGHTCMDILFEHIKSDSELLISESVIAIRHLIQLDPRGSLQHIKTLVKSLPNIIAPGARASIFWLVSENLQILSRVAPDVLRIGAKGFKEEEEQVRIQILTLAVKMYILHCQHSHEEDVAEMNTAIKEADDAQTAQEHEQSVEESETNKEVQQDIEMQAIAEDHSTTHNIDSPTPKLYAYISQLCRYDVSYHLRDRLRTYKILASSPNWVLTQQLLFAAKPIPVFTSASSGRERYRIGSTTLLLGSEVSGYTELPAWSTTVIGRDERNVESKVPAVKAITHNNTASVPPSKSTTPSQTTKPKSKLTGISSLDDFYATSSSEEEESSEDDDEASEESTSEEEEDDDDSTASTETGSNEESEEDTGDDDDHDAALIKSQR